MTSLAELQQLNALGADRQQPITDTSFGAAFDQSFDLAVEADWSISHYIANAPLRGRNERLQQMIRDGEIAPEMVERNRENRGQMRGRINFDAIAQELNEEAGQQLYLTEQDWSEFRARQFEEAQGQFQANMSRGDAFTTGGTFGGALVAGAADPGMLGIGVVTAGVAPALSGSTAAARATKASLTGAEALADLVEAAETVRTVSRWQRAVQLARPAAVEGMLSEGALMLANTENRRQLGLDYTPTEVLAGLGLGTVLGAGLGGAAGGLGAGSYNRMLAAHQEKAAEAIDRLVIEGEQAARVIGEILTGKRDRRGRLVKEGLTEKAASQTPWVGDIKWVNDPRNEEAFIRMVQQQLQQPTETGMRQAAPPASRADAKRTMPLGAWIDGAYRGLSGRGLLRLLNGDGKWNTADFDGGRNDFTVFSSPDRAGKAESGGFVVRFNPDAMVGRMVYRKSDIDKQWANGDVTFRVMNDSKYQGEGRTDNFVADAIDEVRVIDDIAFKSGSKDMKRLRKQMRKHGFTVHREGGVTVFRRREPGPPPTREDLLNSRDALEGAVQRLLDSKDFMKMAPPGVEGLPASYVVDRIQGVTRKWTGVDLRPVTGGRAVAEFETRLGVKVGGDNNPSGLLDADQLADINARFDDLLRERPDLEGVLIEDNAQVTDRVNTVRVAQAVEKQTAELDRLKAALNTCTTGV